MYSFYYYLLMNVDLKFLFYSIFANHLKIVWQIDFYS